MARALSLESDSYNGKFKNILQNGNFRYWQHNVDGMGIGVGSYGGFLGADRWALTKTPGCTGGTVRVSTAMGEVHHGSSPRNVCNAYYSPPSYPGTTDYCTMVHPIENIKSLIPGKEYTLSFEALSPMLDNAPVPFNLMYMYGAGLYENHKVRHLFNIRNTWTLHTYTFIAPSISTTLAMNPDNNWLMLNFWLGAGSYYSTSGGFAPGADLSAKSIYFSNIQLEMGSVATDFEELDEGTQLKMCQRFYERCIPPDIPWESSSLYAHNSISPGSAGLDAAWTTVGIDKVNYATSKKTLNNGVTYAPLVKLYNLGGTVASTTFFPQPSGNRRYFNPTSGATNFTYAGGGLGDWVLGDYTYISWTCFAYQGLYSSYYNLGN